MSKKIIVTGANGQLGSDIVIKLNQEGYDVYGLGREELNITKLGQVQHVLDEVRPDIVVHSAAYTKVDQAESDIDEAYLVNTIGTRNIAVVSEELGAKLIYISTDYVFNGEHEKPYTEFDKPDPLGVYGKSKFAGEEFVRQFHSRFFIIRTSWIYGQNGNNFVKTMLKLANSHEELKVVNDQRGCPTYTVDLANCIASMLKTNKYGTYHVSNSGDCSWYEFSKAIFEILGILVKVNPCTTIEFPRPAKRPMNSVFDHMALRLNGFSEMRSWRDALDEFLHEL